MLAGFLAPEMLAGPNAWQGPPADLWAVGIILAALLAERVPLLQKHRLGVQDLRNSAALLQDLALGGLAQDEGYDSVPEACLA